MKLVGVFLAGFLILSYLCEADVIKIQKRAADFYSTEFLSEQEIQDIKEKNRLAGYGQATYKFEIPETGWYELYVQAVTWPTEIFLNDEFLIYTPFDSGVWETKEKDTYKVLNLYLSKGFHTIAFNRPWHPPLPNIRGFYLQSATDLSGSCRLIPEKDYLAFRKGEKFPVNLYACKEAKENTLIIRIFEAESKSNIKEIVKKIPSGSGNYEERIEIPTETEGVFDIEVIDENGKYLDRIIQYCVVDTRQPSFAGEIKKELVRVIDAVITEPDFSRGSTRVIHTPVGSYRESGETGREKGTHIASWFAYVLDLPTVQEPYLLEIEYPDDDSRTTAIVLVDRFGSPQPGQGYFSGGVYTLSEKILVQDFYFTPRDSDTRLMFYNWNTGERAALSKIKIYKITDGFPALKYGREGRMYGMYQEETMRFIWNFGAAALEGDTWVNFFNSAERVGKLLNYAGINLWFPTIAVYQRMLWPGKKIQGYSVGTDMPGPVTLKEPYKKDIMRIMLLASEKYGLNFIGDLFMPPTGLQRHLDKRLGGKGTLADDGWHKPWLTVSRKGEVGLQSHQRPYYNAAYPGMQEWTGDVFRELIERYKDSPAFKGISIRFLSWCFGGWQTFASINWGYEDYTIELFEQETGIRVPVDKNDPQRFEKRYDYLINNYYKQWVEWRCKKMYEYHSKLAGILTDVRPDMKLYLFFMSDAFAYDVTDKEIQTKGRLAILREAGIDPALYKENPSIVLIHSTGYPLKAGHMDNLVSKEMTGELAKHDKEERSISALSFSTNHEGVYATYEELGYNPAEEYIGPGIGGRPRIYPDSTVNPSGIHYLQRFANAMAEGNMTFLIDGNHGYALGQPAYLRTFLAEYRALPEMAMKPLGDTDPVVLWHGKHKGQNYFYLVNRAYYKADAEVTFSGAPEVKRLSTGKALKTDGNILKIELAPYEMLSFRNAPDSEPKDIKITVPMEEKEILQKQVQFVHNLIYGETDTVEVISLTPSDIRNATKKLEEVRSCLELGHTWRARQLLLQMIKLYEAFKSYPPGLLNRKTVSLPEGAMSAEKIMENLEDKSKADIKDAKEIVEGLYEGKVLMLKEEKLKVRVEIPFKGKYIVWYSYLKGKDFAPPELLYNDRVIGKMGVQQGIYEEMTASKPVVMEKGEICLLIKKKDLQTGLTGLFIEPLFHDIIAEHFHATGPFTGLTGVAISRSNQEMIASKMDETYFPEDEIDFKKKYKVDGKALSWVRPQKGILGTDPDALNYIDLHKTFGEISEHGRGTISYAVTYIYSPEEREASLSVGVDYWAKILVNKEIVLTPHIRPAAPPKKGEIEVPVKLRKGTNEILIKIHAGTAGNGFWMAISDPGDLTYGEPEVYPNAVLTNDVLAVKVYLPDKECGFYRGPRFDWSGMIGRVEYGGHKFFAPWRLPHDPDNPECGIGPAEEFGMGIEGMPVPLGYEEAEEGEGFVKIGVGVLRKEGKRYSFMKKHEFMEHGTWEINEGRNFVEFNQNLRFGKYGYEYTKKIFLPDGKAEFHVFHRLKNTGCLPIDQTVYSHNFMIIDDTPVGPDYIVEFPFLPEGKGDFRGLAEIIDSRIFFLKSLVGEKSIFAELQGDKIPCADNKFTIFNKKSGAGIEVKGSLSVNKFNLWAVATAVCPEPFIKISLKPEEKIEWVNTYRFFTGDLHE